MIFNNMLILHFGHTLIENEILFYDVVNGIIKPSSIKKWYAIKEII
jgi:hypothetical protein